jgi:hypothetical protein
MQYPLAVNHPFPGLTVIKAVQKARKIATATFHSVLSKDIPFLNVFEAMC